MADENINIDYEYSPGEAERTAYVTISDVKLTEMGYIPALGKEKQALAVYNLNSGSVGEGGSVIVDGIDGNIKASVTDLPNSTAQVTLLVDANGDQIEHIQTVGYYLTSTSQNIDGTSSSDASSSFVEPSTVRLQSYDGTNWVKITDSGEAAVDQEGMLLLDGCEITILVGGGDIISTIGGKLNIVNIDR